MGVQVGAKISESDRDQLIRLAEASGRSVSSVVGEAIALYLGKNQPANLDARLQVVERRLDAVEEGQQALRILARQ